MSDIMSEIGSEISGSSLPARGARTFSAPAQWANDAGVLLAHYPAMR